MSLAERACLSEDELLEVAEGRRSLADDATVETHLAGCAACAALLAHLAGAWMAEAPGPPAESLVGRSLGPYQIEAVVGEGGMGRVYRARDGRLDRAVAVKVLSTRVAASAEQVGRLEREARAAGAITHPNVVRVYDVGQVDGAPFLVTELIQGESLRSLIDRRAVPFATALDLGVQLARGVAAAHAKDVVHRDLNPRNVLVAHDGVLKILDFGLAKLTGPRGAALDETTPGTVLGTIGYLSPEQARGEPATPRSDLFAVGAIVYELLSGERAFAGDTFGERISAILRDTPARLAEGESGPLGAAAPAVARCLEKAQDKRFRSADDLAFVLASLASIAPRAPERPAPGISRRVLLATGLGAAAGGILLGRAVRRPAVRGPAAAIPDYRPLSFRQGRVMTARVTADGGSVVYGAAWDGLPPAVHTLRIGGGGERRLDLPAADVLAASSRGELAISIGRRFIDGMHTAGKLALVPIEGGQPRVLAEDVQDADFTPDGADLAAIRRTATGFAVELPLATTLFATDGWLSDVRVSPDGRQVACLVHPSPSDDRGDVVVIDRSTRAARTVSRDWTSLVGLAWSRDGHELWLTATRAGDACALYAVTLDGRERLVTRTTARLRVHDLTPAGAPVVSRDDRRLRTMVGTTVGTTGTMVGRTGGVERDLSLSDISLATELSPDGKTLLCAELGDTAGTSNGAYLRDLTGGPPLRIGDGAPMALSRDGRRVLSLALGPELRLVATHRDTGASERFVLGDVEPRWARWAGDRALIGGSQPGRPPRLWLADPAAPPSPITGEGMHGNCRVSPDGTRGAFVAGGRLHTIDLAPPGAPLPLAGDHAGRVVCGWHADGHSVFLRSKDLPPRVHHVDLLTGETTLHAQIDPPALGLKGLDALVLDALGQVYAYSYGQELSRLYLLDGV